MIKHILWGVHIHKFNQWVCKTENNLSRLNISPNFQVYIHINCFYVRENLCPVQGWHQPFIFEAFSPLLAFQNGRTVTDNSWWYFYLSISQVPTNSFDKVHASQLEYNLLWSLVSLVSAHGVAVSCIIRGKQPMSWTLWAGRKYLIRIAYKSELWLILLKEFTSINWVSSCKKFSPGCKSLVLTSYHNDCDGQSLMII